MIKLHLFTGFENKQLGITSDMELGHLYSDLGDKHELIKAGSLISMKPQWLQDHGSLLHFDLWGKPLQKAKTLFPIVTDVELANNMEKLRERSDED